MMAGLYVVLGVIIGWFAEFIRSYMSKKGENVATHEDINKLVDQMKAVTQATKEIESKLSGDLWDRQKRWELKRDVLFEAAKNISDLASGLLSLQTFWVQRLSAEVTNEAARATLLSQYLTAWEKCTHSFEQTETLISVTCSAKAVEAFAQVLALVRKTAARIVQGDIEEYNKTQIERIKKFATARAAIRHELGVEFTSTPQSSESLVAPSPGSRDPK